MAAIWPVDYGFDCLKAREADIRASEGSNEDTTRMRAIDTVVFEILGWDRTTVETEKFCRGNGFADYVFHREQSVVLVLEAKKDGEAFVLPNRSYGKRPVSFDLIAQECPSAEAAMAQAIGYAAQLGSKYVAISNGHQWLLTLCFVANQPLRKRSVFIFESVGAIVDRFDQFWKCFSPDGAFSNTAAEELLECRKAPPPPKLASQIPNYPAPADRNVIANELSVVLKILWEDLNKEEDRDFLEDCYVTPDISDDALALAKELIDARRRSDEIEMSEALDAKHVPNLIHDYATDKPIVVLGRIGHGKSTLLKYLRLVKAAETLKKYIQININFIDRPDAREDVGSYCLNQVESQLDEKYKIVIDEDGFSRGVLGYDLQKYKSSSEGKLFADDQFNYKRHEVSHIVKLQQDRHNYLAKVFRHLKKGRGYSIAIFFDNLDRRVDPIQEEAFLKASAMARDWGCLVFVCLRPSTFFRSKGDGVLDSLAPKTISVVSPKLSVVLKKRFRYARRLAEGENIRGKIGRAAVLDPSLTFDLPRVVEFLECCERSFFKNRKLSLLFEAVSNGDIREALRYVGDVLVSQHFNTKKILEFIEQEEDYVISDHEAQRALLYGDSFHYDPSRSVFVNLFDTLHADPMEHFSRFLTLHYLNRIGQGPPARGYCSIQSVSQYLCQLGYSDGHAKQTIEFLYSKKCCEPRIPEVVWTAVGDGDIRITNLGRYHTAHLICTFEYLDAVVVDTPIINATLKKIIRDEWDILSRIDRAKMFADYLQDCSQAMRDADAIAAWSQVYTELNKDFGFVRLRADRARERRASE
jgi:hypothetical protein